LAGNQERGSRKRTKSIEKCLSSYLCFFSSTFWHNYQGIFLDLQHVFPALPLMIPAKTKTMMTIPIPIPIPIPRFPDSGNDEAVVALEVVEDVAHNCHNEHGTMY